MTQEDILTAIRDHVRNHLEGEGSGHDWWHIVRVRNTAVHLGKLEGADLLTVELTALLHDIADWKFHDGDETIGPKVAREIMEKHGVEATVVDHVCTIIANMSYHSTLEGKVVESIEGKVVQDADRLDAIGAIGIARTFAYGGHKGHPLHNPDLKPRKEMRKEDYLNEKNTTINHFYEKLLLLKDKMNTQAAKDVAQQRHAYMQEYLEQFYAEWNGER